MRRFSGLFVACWFAAGAAPGQPAPAPPTGIAPPPRAQPPELPAPLTLRDVQERARRADPRAQQAAAQLLGAQGKRDEAHWAFFPQFQTTAYVAGPTTEARLKGGDADPVPTDVTPNTGRFLRGEVGVQLHADVQAILPLWTFGKLSAAKEAADHAVGAYGALVQRAQDQAAFDAARAYWGYQTARNADATTQKTRDRIAQAQKTAEKLLEGGSDQVSRTDLQKLAYLAEEIEAQRAAALKGRDLALAGLKLLIGARPSDDVAIAQQELPEAPAVPDAGAVVQRALARRPETVAAAEQAKARGALVDYQRAQLWPDLGLVGGARFTETTNASNPSSPFLYNPYHEGTGYIALGLRGTFDVPQKLARIRQAEADQLDALAQQRGAEALIRLEVQQALGDLAEARVKVERYTKQAAIGKQLATQAAIAFDSGLGDARELLEDTLLFARADGERLSALLAAQVAWAALEKAAGGPL